MKNKPYVFSEEVKKKGYDKALIDFGKRMYRAAASTIDNTKILKGGKEMLPPSYDQARIREEKTTCEAFIKRSVAQLSDMAMVTRVYKDLTPEAAIKAYRNSLSDEEWESERRSTTIYVSMEELRKAIDNDEPVPDDEEIPINEEEAIKFTELIWYGDKTAGSVKRSDEEYQKLLDISDKSNAMGFFAKKKYIKTEVPKALTCETRLKEALEEYCAYAGINAEEFTKPTGSVCKTYS